MLLYVEHLKEQHQHEVVCKVRKALHSCSQLKIFVDCLFVGLLMKVNSFYRMKLYAKLR